MLIKCPKCGSVYVVDADKIPEGGKKFKCAECSTVWVAEKKDLFDAENKVRVKRVQTDSIVNDEDENVRKMFEILNQDTKGLFTNLESQNISNKEIRTKKRTFKDIVREYKLILINTGIIIAILILTGFISYYNRYFVARIIPLTENVYKQYNLDCIYYGRDLKFNDITTKYITKKGKHYIEVHGNINNESGYKIQIPPIKARITRENGEFVNEIVKDSIIPTVDPHFGSLFRILIESMDNEKKILDLSFLTKSEYEEYKLKLQKEEEEKNKPE